MGASRNIGVYTILFIIACAIDNQTDLEHAVDRLLGTKDIFADSHFAKLSVVFEFLLSRKRPPPPVILRVLLQPQIAVGGFTMALIFFVIPGARLNLSGVLARENQAHTSSWPYMIEF